MKSADGHSGIENDGTMPVGLAVTAAPSHVADIAPAACQDPSAEGHTRPIVRREPLGKTAQPQFSRGALRVLKRFARSSVRPAMPLALAVGQFKADRRASAAIEFAVVGLLSLELVLEAMQAGLYFYTSAAVERASSKGTRAIITGSVSSQGLTATQFRANVVCPAISAFNLSCSNVITNVQTVSEAVSPGGFYTFLNSTQTALKQPTLDNSQTSYCTGTSQSYVVVQILYAMPIFSPFWKIFATTFNGSASYILQSTAAFRNEPFPPGSLNC